jgi:hypothetical protein
MGGTGRREGKEGGAGRERRERGEGKGKGLSPPKVNFLVTSLTNPKCFYDSVQQHFTQIRVTGKKLVI